MHMKNRLMTLVGLLLFVEWSSPLSVSNTWPRRYWTKTIVARRWQNKSPPSDQESVAAGTVSPKTFGGGLFGEKHKPRPIFLKQSRPPRQGSLFGHIANMRALAACELVVTEPWWPHRGHVALPAGRPTCQHGTFVVTEIPKTTHAAATCCWVRMTSAKIGEKIPSPPTLFQGPRVLFR